MILRRAAATIERNSSEISLSCCEMTDSVAVKSCFCFSAQPTGWRTGGNSDQMVLRKLYGASQRIWQTQPEAISTNKLIRKRLEIPESTSGDCGAATDLCLIQSRLESQHRLFSAHLSSHSKSMLASLLRPLAAARLTMTSRLLLLLLFLKSPNQREPL